MEDRLARLQAFAESSSANRIEWRERNLGIITSSIAYQYVREVWPEASVLKLGMSYPFPDALIREFAAGVSSLLVVEELDDFIEQHVMALGIACRGRDIVPGIMELSVDRLLASRAEAGGKAGAGGKSPPCSRIACRPARRCSVPAVLIAASSMPWEKRTWW